MSQMALADEDNRISTKHPIYEDIATSRLMRWGKMSTSCFSSLYAIDPEELLCYHQEDSFLYELIEGRGLKARFKAALSAARQDMQTNIWPGAKHAVDAFRLR